MEIGRLPLNGKNVGTTRYDGLLWEKKGSYDLCQMVSRSGPLLSNCFGLSPEIAGYPGHCATETMGHDIFLVNPCILGVQGHNLKHSSSIHLTRAIEHIRLISIMDNGHAIRIGKWNDSSCISNITSSTDGI